MGPKIVLNRLVMKLNFALVCDYASTDQNGKLNAIGVFTSITPRKDPPVMVVKMVCVAHVAITDSSQHLLEIKFKDSKGRAVIPVEKQYKQEFSLPEDKRYAQFIWELNNTKLDSLGEYKFEVYGDGKFLGSTEFFLETV